MSVAATETKMVGAILLCQSRLPLKNLAPRVDLPQRLTHARLTRHEVRRGELRGTHRNGVSHGQVCRES